MKNKKGFTLVELLAVIAILAILVIMALPAVLRMFNNARRDSFTNEVNTVIRTARQQYLLSGGSDTKWSNVEGSTKSLDLTGNRSLKYYVEMNGNGQITTLQVTNGDFQYDEAGIIDIAESSDVVAVTSENELVIDPACKYKVITDRGSFSTTEDVKELCINTYDDGYTYTSLSTIEHSYIKRDDTNTMFLFMNMSKFNEDSFVRIYRDSTKAELLEEITYADRAQDNRISISDINSAGLPIQIIRVLDGQVPADFYIESSSDVCQQYSNCPSNKTSYAFLYTSTPIVTTVFKGPWVDMESLNAGLSNISSSLSALGYVYAGIDSCANYGYDVPSTPGTKLAADPNPGTNEILYSYPNCGVNKWYVKYATPSNESGTR